ncbi:hypothetical protein J5226_06945 [Lysobacter sp. K5869]|uniref:hypothetical protein n=1 Tax=Lysobacter sp. K5869 TaxID=2820808 RepID=UPI001C063BEE|nr:hypothetical protein [Lysobacter sp. K5869]QWP78126.1 hypothetical protein J5226_06945 [Lysobacter sp. K5869]
MGNRLGAALCGLTLALGLVATGAHAQTAKAAEAGAAASGKDAANDTGIERALLRQRLIFAQTLASNGGAQLADRTFTEAIAMPAFAELPAAARHTALAAAGRAALQTDDMPRAADLYRRATQAGDDADDWYRLALIESELERPEAAAQAFIHLTEHWPEALAKVDESTVFRLQYLLPRGSDTRLDLLQALFAANWTSRTSDPSTIWLSLTEMLVDRDRRDEARAVAKRVVGPIQVVALRSDKRFDFMVAADSWALNVDNASRRQLELLRQQAEVQPRSLDARSQLGYALLIAGLDDEALALNDEVKQRIADAPAAQPPYDDPREQAWLMNTASIALRRQGRIAPGIAELERASRLGDADEPNVSQTLNLAEAYCRVARPDDALATLDRVGDSLTGYARMIVHNIRACVATAKRDTAATDTALRYLREHRSEGNQVYLEALLRAGRLDDAARTLSEQLASREDRLDALTWLQEYRVSENPLPGDVALREARKTLLAREDVQAEVAKVGRIGRYAIYGEGQLD